MPSRSPARTPSTSRTARRGHPRCAGLGSGQPGFSTTCRRCRRQSAGPIRGRTPGYWPTRSQDCCFASAHPTPSSMPRPTRDPREPNDGQRPAHSGAGWSGPSRRRPRERGPTHPPRASRRTRQAGPRARLIPLAVPPEATPPLRGPSSQGPRRQAPLCWPLPRGRASAASPRLRERPRRTKRP